MGNLFHYGKVLIYENGFWLNLSPSLPPSLLPSSPKEWAQVVFETEQLKAGSHFKKMGIIGEIGIG